MSTISVQGDGHHRHSRIPLLGKIFDGDNAATPCRNPPWPRRRNIICRHDDNRLIMAGACRWPPAVSAASALDFRRDISVIDMTILAPLTRISYEPRRCWRVWRARPVKHSAHRHTLRPAGWPQLRFQDDDFIVDGAGTAHALFSALTMIIAPEAIDAADAKTAP